MYPIILHNMPRSAFTGRRLESRYMKIHDFPKYRLNLGTISTFKWFKAKTFYTQVQMKLDSFSFSILTFKSFFFSFKFD